MYRKRKVPSCLGRRPVPDCMLRILYYNLSHAVKLASAPTTKCLVALPPDHARRSACELLGRMPPAQKPIAHQLVSIGNFVLKRQKHKEYYQIESSMHHVQQ